ncbi:MAG: hypothetical protein LBJ62_09850 [Bifidobacteriaceae bacterium]|nr:hypothetical protein [Bifidobacteriaceae bacterium]
MLGISDNTAASDPCGPGASAGINRLAPADAARLIHSRLLRVQLLKADTAARIHLVLAQASISGGSVYDALVALTASEHDALLGTRDARAARTYQALGAEFKVLS